MIISESAIRNIVRRELVKFLKEQEETTVDSENGSVNLELPQDEEETKVTMSAEEIAQIALDIADSDESTELESSEIENYLNERKRK
jgi:hypothetical protein